jgi:hypothetical protein
MMAETIEASERDLLADTLRRLTEQFDGELLSKALADFGYDKLLDEAPREAVSALFDALGRGGSMSAELHDVLLQPLTGLFNGATEAHCVVLPRIGAAVSGSLDGGTVSLRGLVIGRRPATAFLAPVTAGHETAWVCVADSSAVTRRVAAGLDSALTVTDLSATGVAATVVAQGEQASLLWKAVATAGRRALGYHIVGAVGAMIWRLSTPAIASSSAVRSDPFRLYGIGSRRPTWRARLPRRHSKWLGKPMTNTWLACWPNRWPAGRRGSRRRTANRC